MKTNKVYAIRYTNPETNKIDFCYIDSSPTSFVTTTFDKQEAVNKLCRMLSDFPGSDYTLVIYKEKK